LNLRNTSSVITRLVQQISWTSY